VPVERAEAARALMIELFPEGFEEHDRADGLELAAYTDAAGEERLWAAFGRVAAEDVPRGWEERWRDFHRPVRVGDLWVGPPWEAAPPGVEAIVVDPGRAFGTGGHATTRLCLELLANAERGSLLDVGCGSGVLAIAAVRLGFGPVLAVDHDASAVEATRRNAEANGVALECRRADAFAEPLPAADVAVVNISREAAEGVLPRLDVDLVLTSGYLERDRPSAAGFRPERRVTHEGWAADVLRREG
jgi:ribosomal protein L11 methyltransferase